MKKILLPLLALAITTSSCDKYLDINEDPNSPSQENVSNDLIIKGVEMNLATSYGNFFRTLGGYYAQQYAQLFGTSNYLDFSQFISSQNRSSTTYTQLNTRVLNNLETIRKSSTASSDWGTNLAATTLRVFTYQVLVDAYGETPYTEALQADVLAPKYDEGSVVYTGIIAELDEALSKVTENTPVVETFLFGKSSSKEWIQFANALKLKMLMRMSKVQDVKAEVAALIAKNNFPTSDITWSGIWLDETGKANPFYQEEFATYFGSNQKNVSLNVALLATMEDSEDARLAKFFDANSSGQYRGGVSGSNFSTSKVYNATFFNRPAVQFNSPLSLITKAEVEFFIAEYYAQTGAAVNAKTHYDNAIIASFTSAGLKAEDADNIINGVYAYSNANYQKLIGIQKWVALSGTNNFEAWTELRRLKFPTFGDVSGTQIYNSASDTYKPELLVPGTLYTPISVFGELGDKTILQRIRYAQSSTNANSNAPSVKPDKEPIFWAK
jgi:hypothetical protein